MKHARTIYHNPDNFKSSNKISKLKRTLGEEIKRADLAEAIIEEGEQKNTPPVLMKAHNCEELATIAKTYIRARYRTLVVNLVGEEMHGYAVIGQLPHSKTLLNDFAAWPKHLVVCDPWTNIVCMANDYPGEFRAKMEKWAANEKEIFFNERWVSANDKMWINAVLNGSKPVD